MQSIMRSPTNPAVVYAFGTTMWRSTDGGVHWAPFGGDMGRVNAVDVDIGDGPDGPFFASWTWFYRSVGGRPWQQYSSQLPTAYSAYLVDPVDRTHLLGVRLTGAYADGLGCSWVEIRRSTDSGVTWRDSASFNRRCAVPSDTSIFGRTALFVPHPTRAGTSWLLVRDGGDRTFLWRTEDLGTTWHAETAPPIADSIAIPPPGEDLVASGFVLGLATHWHRPLAGGPWTAGTGSCAATTPEPFILVTGMLAGCAGAAPTTNRFTDLVQGSGGFTALASHGAQAVMRQVGGTWVPSATGLAAQNITGAVRLADGSIAISGELGMFRQAAGGAWESWNEGLPPDLANGYPGVEVLAGDHAGRALAISFGKLYRRGAADPSWVPVPGGPADGYVTSVTRPSSAAQPLYLTGQDGTSYASDDDGATWRRMTDLPGPAVFFTPSPTQPGVAFAGAGTLIRNPDGTIVGISLYRTLDAGVTWDRLPYPSGYYNRLAIDPKDPGHLVMNGGSTGLLVSHDGGSTWRGRDNGPVTADGNSAGPTMFAFDRDAPGVIYVGTYWAGLWASADDGVTWGPVAGSDTGASVLTFLEEIAPSPTGAARARAASNWRLYATIGRVRSGFARIDARVRLPKLAGKPHTNVRRTERVATCSGASVVGGGPSLTLWLAGRTRIGTGRRFRVPVSAVGLAVRCEFRADSPFANVVRKTRAVTLVGRPYTPRPTIAGGRHVGSGARCPVRWRGKPISTSVVWRVGGEVRGTGSRYIPAAGDAGRRLSCTAAGRNRYGTYSTSAKSVKVRR